MRFPNNWIFAGLLAGALGLSYLTIERSPTVWIDEVSYSDPGVNLALGNGFKSSAWYSGPKEELWVGNTPLYPLLLAGWVKLFGFDIVPVRLLNFVLFAFACIAVWGAVCRLHLFRTASAQFWLFALLLLGFGPTYVYRNGRPDCLLLLLFGLMFLAVSLDRRWLRYGLCGVAAFLVPFAGLGGLPYLAICGILYLMLAGKRGFPEFLVIGCSSALGVVALWATYTSLGMWEGFRVSTSAHSTIVGMFHGSESLLSKVSTLLGNFLGDISLLVLVGGVLGAQCLSRLTKRDLPPPDVTILSVFTLVVPLIMMVVGTFPVYYAWMMYVPAAFAWALWYDQLSGEKTASRSALLLAMGVAVLALAGGLPLRTVLAVSQWTARDYAPVREFASAVVRPDDVVYCDPQAYYAVKPRARNVFTGSYDQAMSGEEREAVDLLLVDPSQSDKFKKMFGGEWKPVSSDVVVTARRNSFGASTYNLEAWRRIRE
jgi:hypothetical protein